MLTLNPTTNRCVETWRGGVDTWHLTPTVHPAQSCCRAGRYDKEAPSCPRPVRFLFLRDVVHAVERLPRCLIDVRVDASTSNPHMWAEMVFLEKIPFLTSAEVEMVLCDENTVRLHQATDLCVVSVLTPTPPSCESSSVTPPSVCLNAGDPDMDTMPVLAWSIKMAEAAKDTTVSRFLIGHQVSHSLNVLYEAARVTPPPLRVISVRFASPTLHLLFYMSIAV